MSLLRQGNTQKEAGRVVRFAASAQQHGNDDSAEQLLGVEGNSDDNDMPLYRKRSRDAQKINDTDDYDDDMSDGPKQFSTISSDTTTTPSEHDLLEAKRQRRLARLETNDSSSNTHIDNTTSLSAEGIAIEPFHMRQEESDGTGYFDGDTYIFRRDNDDDNNDEDAWLDSLNNNDTGGSTKTAPYTNTKSNATNVQSAVDNMSDETLYVRIIPLVSDTETIMQAISRYGAIIKRDKTNSKRREDSAVSKSPQMALQALNTLTEASSALLIRGQTSIYQKTRNDVIKLITKDSGLVATTVVQPADATTAVANAIPKRIVNWEYSGKEDGQIHGPYTTAEMLAWTRLGYFMGESAVQVRTIESCDSANTNSLQDDLLADLEDDDEQDDNEEKKSQLEEQVRGEWRLSSVVNFSDYA